MIAEDWPFEQSSTPLPPPRHLASGFSDGEDARAILHAAMRVVAASRVAFLGESDSVLTNERAN